LKKAKLETLERSDEGEEFSAGVDAALTFTDLRKDGRILVLSFINCLARSSMTSPEISGSPRHPQVILRLYLEAINSRFSYTTYDPFWLKPCSV
jgi:hypothetical protein